MRRRLQHATRRLVPRPIVDRFRGLGQALARMLKAPIRAAQGSLTTFSLMVVMLAFIGGLGVTFVNQILIDVRLQERRAELQQEVADLEATNSELTAALDFARSDVNVEQLARDQLGMAREGDIVILPNIALPEPTAAPAPPPVPLAAPAREPNWQRWYQTLFSTSP